VTRRDNTAAQIDHVLTELRKKMIRVAILQSTNGRQN